MQVFIDYLGELNVLAVVIAALAAFVSGAIWYAEAVFGKQWKKAVGLSDKQLNSKDMRDVMGLSALSVLVSAVAMALLVKVLVLTTVYQGALFGAMIAIGILGMNKLMQTKFERRSMTYWYIALGADILAFGLMGAILAAWN